MDGVSPPLAPSQGCEQETTSAEMTGRRHEAGRQSFPPRSRSQSGMRAGDDDGGTTEVQRGRTNHRSTLGRADPEQGPP